MRNKHIIADLESQIEEKDLIIESLEDDIDNLKANLEAAEQEIENLQNELENLKVNKPFKSAFKAMQINELLFKLGGESK